MLFILQNIKAKKRNKNKSKKTFFSYFLINQFEHSTKTMTEHFSVERCITALKTVQ